MMGLQQLSHRCRSTENYTSRAFFMETLDGMKEKFQISESELARVFDRHRDLLVRWRNGKQTPNLLLRRTFLYYAADRIAELTHRGPDVPDYEVVLLNDEALYAAYLLDTYPVEDVFNDLRKQAVVPAREPVDFIRSIINDPHNYDNLDAFLDTFRTVSAHFKLTPKRIAVACNRPVREVKQWEKKLVTPQENERRLFLGLARELLNYE